MNDNLLKAKAFLVESFDKSEYYKNPEKLSSKSYRLNHSFRVTNIGIKIAMAENLNVEAAALGCLLHDISYIGVFESRQDIIDHGRTSARIARPFLESLNLSRELVNEICYGIAIHVDDEADFEGSKTPLALTIGDSDNIDRFDAYRIYDNLLAMNFCDMSEPSQREKVDDIIQKLNKHMNSSFATPTATQLWHEKLEFQISFFSRLRDQLKMNDLFFD